MQDLGGWTISFFFVSFLLPSILLFSYLFNQVLVPQYLIPAKYGLFSLYLVYSIIASIYLQIWVLIGTFVLLEKFQIEGLSSLTDSVRTMALLMMIIVLIQSLILFLLEHKSNSEKLKQLRIEINSSRQQIIQVRSNRKFVNLVISEILFVESLSDYILIHLISGDKIKVKEPISKFYDKLPNDFIRIHRSFVVNQKMISEYSREQVNISGMVLPISRSYKKEVAQKMGT